jgi:hypothetical protein
MTVPTTAQLNLLNSHPQMTKLYLSIYQPETVMSFQITGSAAKGDTTLNGNTLSGSYLLVESEVFTALVGTTAGGDDKGRIRVRSATANTVVVPINSHINWANGDYITILRYVEINPVYQRIIQDPSDPMNTLWYKYSDIAYSNQNSVLGSFICMGGHYAGFLDGGQCNVYYSASGTYNLKSEAMIFDWFFQGADTTGSAVHTPGYISYSTPGHYMTKLTVTTSGSASDISYRFISIYDRPEAGATNPIVEWELIDMSGNRDAGGYTASIRVRGTAYENVVRDGALVIIHAEDWYTRDTKQSIGGNALNRSSIFFSGYIMNGTIQYNYQDGYVEFEVASPTEVMKSMEGFAIDVTSSTDPAGQSASDPNYPSGWVLLLDMDGRRAIYHYLRWHSTVLYCTDFDVNYFGTDIAIEHFTSDRTSIYDAINTLMQSTYIGEIVADRQGRIFAEVTVQGTNNASGSFAISMEIEKRHWIETPMIEERQIQEMSFLEMGGILYNGPSAGTFSAFLSCAPGNEPALRGKIEQAQGLALSSQSQLNTLVGNVFAYKNSRYPNIDFRLAGNYRNLDIAPQELVSISVAQSDTPRGIVFDRKPFAIRNMSWMFDHTNELILPSIGVAEVTQGFAGDTIVIPDVPPTEGDAGGGFYIPPIIVPPLPMPTIPIYLSTPRMMILHPAQVLTAAPSAGIIDWSNGSIYPPISYSGNYYDPDFIWDLYRTFVIKYNGYYAIDINYQVDHVIDATSDIELYIHLREAVAGIIATSNLFFDHVETDRLNQLITFGPCVLRTVLYFGAGQQLTTYAGFSVSPGVTLLGNSKKASIRIISV